MSRTTIAVVDSGWDRTIESPRVLRGIGIELTSGGGVRISPDDQDRNGHGTSVCDLILQVAPHAQVVPIRIFPEELEASPLALVAAIDWAIKMKIQLLNLSLGTRLENAKRPLYAACQRAVDAGCIVVAASGENGSSYPATFYPVIGVECADVPRRFDIIYTPGKAIEVGARGTSQRARGLRGATSIVSGSSFAAPIVTGRIARAIQSGPIRGVEGVRLAMATGAFSLY